MESIGNTNPKVISLECSLNLKEWHSELGEVSLGSPYLAIVVPEGLGDQLNGQVGLDDARGGHLVQVTDT